MSAERLNSLRLVPQNETCLISPFWRLESGDCCKIWGNICSPLIHTSHAGRLFSVNTANVKLGSDMKIWWRLYRVTQKKRELLENATKIEEIQEKKIDRNWTITTCLLRDSNPDYQCLKITSCRWRPPSRMHSFTATTHFKSSRSFVSPCVDAIYRT